MNQLKRYVVELKVPDDADDDTVKKYLQTAISTECGCRNPEEYPMY